MIQSRKLIGIIACAGAVIILVLLIIRSNNAGFSLVAEIPLDHASSSAASAPQALVKKEPIPPPKILFSEIFPNPGGNDTGKEFITLYNAGEYDVDLKDWTIQVLKSGAALRETFVKIGSQPADITVIRAPARRSSEPQSEGGNMSYIIGFSGNTVVNANVSRKAALPNSASTYFLIDADGEVRDEVFVPAMPEGETFQRP